MQGYNDSPDLRGVIPLSFNHMFENIKGSVNTAFLVRCAYLEVSVYATGIAATRESRGDARCGTCPVQKLVSTHSYVC